MFATARTDLLRHLRRIWMGAPFKRAPYSLIAATLSTGADGTKALARTLGALKDTLAGFGTVFDVGPTTIAVVMPNVALHQARKIAQAILAAIDEREGRLRFCAAVAALHRDGDPTALVCAAETCLGIALAAPCSTVVCETDPATRSHLRR